MLAGPLCARTLLDLGAEVIKVEPPTPDVSRFAFPSKEGMSGYYAQQNAGKRNVQAWILSFPDAATLDAQFDEAKIAMGKVRSIRALAQSEWCDYWGGVQDVSDRHGGTYHLPAAPGASRATT